MDTKSVDVDSLSQYLQYENRIYNQNVTENVMVESALIEDAVVFFAKMLKSSNRYLGKTLFCEDTDAWEHGQTVVNIMKTVKF